MGPARLVPLPAGLLPGGGDRVPEGCITSIEFPAGSPFTGIDYGDRRHVVSLPIREEVENNTKWAYDVTVLLEGSVFVETDPRMIIDP